VAKLNLFSLSNMYGVPARKYSLSDGHLARGQFLKKRARQAVKASFFSLSLECGRGNAGGAIALCESTAGKIVFLFLLIDFYGENQVEIVSQVAKVLLRAWIVGGYFEDS